MNTPSVDSSFAAQLATQLTLGLPVELVALTPTYVPQMAQLESMAHSHPMSEGSLADCFGHLYRVLGLKLSAGSDANTNAVSDFASDPDSVDGLLGFAIVQQIVDEVTLLDICLLPSQQGKGYGKLLLNAVVASAKASAAVVLMLEVRESNLAARALYQKAGFIESGRRKGYYPIAGGKEDAILMDLAITQE
ncbi:GNAT family N-acetyltransferase [Shewanella baltica]|uniref:GNAT family N-acetyltransferase n=1 Tax=Shewanella baltica TaxID=62322 RepID=UPI00217DBFAA|nr:GNAT family N-acetyltransferase [Shewanella baltica]MCS6122374.1 GNAT family N-acetyltransferase [Shewanella baltica]